MEEEREAVCGQTLANASSAAYICKSADLRRERGGHCVTVRHRTHGFHRSCRHERSSQVRFVDPAEYQQHKNEVSADNPGFRAVNIPDIIRLPYHQLAAVPARRRKKSRWAHVYRPGSPKHPPVVNRKSVFRKSNCKLNGGELMRACGRKICSRSDTDLFFS